MRQIAPIAIALAFSPGLANGFQLSLDPVELGRVEIRVQRDGDAHSVRVMAERPETLALLLRDRQELDRSLADAGLRVEAKGIEFSLSAQSGPSDQRQQGGARSGTSGAGSLRGRASTDAEPPPARLQRGLLDLNI
jgi:flagellar hook-length control protein FliK